MEPSQDPAAPATAALPARGTVFHLACGFMAAQAVASAARLRVMDRIGDGEMTADALAEECGADAQAMLRLLRALAALDLLAESGPGRFSLAAGGSLLRADRPGSLHAFVLMLTDPALTRAWEHLEESVRTGRPAFDGVFGTDFFTYVGENPELSARFNTAMSDITRATAEGLPEQYDFGRFRAVVDVGGGDGTLLAGILRAYPALRGTVFDTREGLAQAEETLRRAGVGERCSVESGDFFAAVPGGGDLYLLKSVLHDWDDDRAASILGHCRRAVPDHGRLLIIEPVLPATVDSSVPPLMYLNDLNMLVNLGGRERTRAEFTDLCARAGFTLTSVRPLWPPNEFSLIEAAPAPLGEGTAR
ncbi:methyltransferase [Marinitenerispora sediminis]|uniref:Methyltransferase n=1 Tax=Marinitenerispora sediminis TaxID=1931232 RepID=A0A368T8V0_9ACTN|nr:methyltransferase [Marinitenerispora sediminis]RCV52073.1 methyltransferase [Marinitenerispora sediminis]RCV58092.1 methyltransferase [Marinitenerispora sediminis]RCV60846.1 methyltransferase [Marinitenerispora sediminis]